MAMLATAIFDRLFYKSNISAMDMLVVVKFHTNIANRWHFTIQIKTMVNVLYSESYFDMFRGLLPDTVYKDRCFAAGGP